MLTDDKLEDMAEWSYTLGCIEPKSKDFDKGKIGGRLFVGYSFLPYFSLETGYTYYPDNKYKIAGIDAEYKHGKSAMIAENKIKFYTIDLMTKCILPLEHLSTILTGWNLYGKLGIAAISFSRECSYDVSISYYDISANYTNHSNITKRKFNIRPAYGFGVSYNFTDHFNVDLSWSGVYSRDKYKLDDVNYMAVPSANLMALGISYKF